MKMDRKVICSVVLALSLLGFFIMTATTTGFFDSNDHMSGVYFARSFLQLIMFQSFFMVVLFRDEVAKILIKFFSATSHPLNLAIFRIYIFYTIWKLSFGSSAVFFSTLPKELLYPPPGFEKIIQYLPINPELAALSGVVLKIAAFMAMIGLCTRISSWIAIIAALYFLGVPQLFGKVNHIHFIVWFGAVLAASPCSRVFSVDAIIDGFRKAQKGIFENPTPSQAYGLPIRLIFILMGVLYFFPGLWKFYFGGMDWIFSDNLINRMYFKWYELDGWLPFFRIDKYPILCQIGAGMTIFFEMSLVFLVFFDKWRYLAIGNGIFFHTMTLVFMKINFLSLQMCYIIFFDWHKIFSWIGKKIFKQPISLIIEDKALLRKCVAFIKVFDVFQQTEYFKKEDSEVLDDKNIENYSLCVIQKQKTYVGSKALIILALRNPVLLGLLPILLFVFRKKTVKIAETLKEPQHVSIQNTPEKRRPVSKVTVLVGTVLIVANSYCGFTGIDSWPFAIFPTFANAMLYPNKTTMDIMMIDDNGNEISIDQEMLSSKFGSPRYWGLMYRILYERNESIMVQKLSALLKVTARYDPNIVNVKTLKVYKSLYSMIPENRGKDPIKKDLIITLNVNNEE